MLTVVEHPSPALHQSTLHLLVPQGVDEGVEHGGDHGVEDGGHLIQAAVARRGL